MDIKSCRYTVIYDACVLYPAPLRDLLVELAATGLFRAKWTDHIHEEWITNLLKNRSDITREQLERTRELMNLAVNDCLVRGYEPLTSSLTLPDEDDRHVLAAAIAGCCDAIITNNLKDFPRTYLAQFDIEAQGPDEFIYNQFDLGRSEVIIAASRVRKRLCKPHVSAEDYLAILEKQGLAMTSSELAKYKALI